MTLENRRINLQREWLLADTCWREAEILLASGEPRGALTRFYYSAYHAACSALLSLGLEASTHSGVRHLFSRHFLKDHLMDPRLARNLASLQQQREDADYERDLEISLQQAQWARAEALEVRQAIHLWLTGEGWL